MINFLLLLAVIFWGLSFVGTKMALVYLTPVEIIAVRMFLGLPVLMLATKLRRVSFNFARGDYIIILISSLLIGTHFLIQAVGLIYTTATNTAWLIATIPVFIALLSYIFLGEKLSPMKLAGIAAATAGVFLLISNGHFNSIGWIDSVGDWIILASCVTWSVYTIITRNITRRVSPLAVSLGILLLPAVALVLYTLAVTPVGKFMHLPWHIILILIFLAVFCLGLAHWLWLEGLSRKGAADVGVFIYLEPLVTTIAAIPILGEKITIFIIIGALLIISGVYMVQKRPLPISNGKK
ncbi:MAG: DMT family transporter [Candidatus Zixiibacteriota bacterium]